LLFGSPPEYLKIRSGFELDNTTKLLYHYTTNPKAFEVKFYTTLKGESPVKDFLLQLDTKARAKMVKYLEMLQEQGPNLRRPYADVGERQDSGIKCRISFESASGSYFSFRRNDIILLHAFLKKSQKLKEQDVALAENRMNDWISRKSTITEQ